MRVIQRLTVPGYRDYIVGKQCNGIIVIEIKNVSAEYEDCIHSEYHVLDEDGGADRIN